VTRRHVALNINAIVEDLVDTTLGALADPTRRRVVDLLRVEPRPASVIAERLGMTPAATSRHLRVLRNAGLVEVDTPAEDARLRVYEGGGGGRLLEEDDTSGCCVERAKITVWDVGERLVFVDRRSTEVEVSFQAVERGTRVVLEHRGLDRLPPDAASSTAKHGWRGWPGGSNSTCTRNCAAPRGG